MGVSVALVGELDTVGDWGLLATDAALVVTRWNRWLERHTGTAAAAAVGRPLFDLFPDLTDRKFDRHFRQALAGRTVVLAQRFHRYLLRMPPSVVGTGLDHMHQSARVVPLTDGGAVVGTLALIEDVTERVAHEAAMRDQVEALNEQDKRKDEFLAMLAHELRNPLAPIRNAVEILRLVAGSAPQVKGPRDVIDRQVTHLVRLVDDLLDVARVQRGKVTLQLGPVDLGGIVSAAVETARPLFDARSQELNVRLPDRPVRLTGDSARLTQVLVNLLNNAAKYSPDGSPVALTAEAELGHAVVRVTDRGAGIPGDMLGKVFDLFAQVDRTLDRAQGGLGIGLTLVQRLVQMHGGTVEARSDGPGQGSEFTVRLPAAVTADAPGPPPAPAPAGRTASGLRVLVIDDNRDAADTLGDLLRGLGHEAAVAYDGEAGLAAARASCPAVAFVDLGLPRVDGHEVARRLRAEFGGAAPLLIAVSGYGRPEDRDRGRAAGFDHHLTKPVEVRALREALESAGGR